MATLTPLDLESARTLGAGFGLDVTSVRGILAGSVNSNYELTLASGGRAFLRVYEEQTQSTASREARLLDHLAERGVPTPRPMHRTNADGFIAEHRSKPVAVFPWRDGEILCQKRVDDRAAHRVGAALAKVHVAGASFEGSEPSRFGAEQLMARIADLRARELTKEIAGAVDRLARALDERLARGPAEGSIPVIHGDLFRDNVLWSGGEIAALLDFESASSGLAAFDVMVTALSWCFGDRLEIGLVRALGAGYASERTLSLGERAALFDEARFAAIRFSVTRITDFELRPRGSGVYKDYRRFLARLDAITEIGPAALATFVAP
jgi:homoserine kinase type II